MLAPNVHIKERYRILHKIGGGGFGYVYKAIDEVFGCSVAIKETREEVASRDKLRRAFEREAKLLRNLKHDSLPRVTDYFFQAQAQFLVMDFIEGEDFATRLKKRLQQHKGPFTCQELLPFADKILAALEYLHGRPEPIIHRDIKPANIKLTDDGEVYLLDFGLAKGVTGQMSTIIEGQPTSIVPGCTVEYAPLEQLHGTETEPQSDIYALGATLYHLLTGQLPISASRRDEALQRGQGDPLKPAHEVNPTIPLAVSQVISQALAVRWWDRIGSANEMRAALKRACEETVTTQPGPAPQSDAQPAPLVPKDHLSTLPLQPLHNPEEPANINPTLLDKTPARSLSLRRSVFIAGFALVLLAGLFAIARLTFPRWFTPAVLTKPETQATPSPENLKPPVIATPKDLKIKRELKVHGGTIWSVTFSRDSRLAASAGQDRNVILWDTETWTYKLLAGHKGEVYSLAFSPDSTILASASGDGTIRLWDTQTGQLVRDPLSESAQPVLRVAFSPDGNMLASSSGSLKEGGEEIRLWHVHNQWTSTLLAKPADKVIAVAFSPDSRFLASTGFGNVLHLWSLMRDGSRIDLSIDQLNDKNSQWTKQLANAPSCTKLAFSEDGRYLACGSSDTTIKLWLYNPQTQEWTKLKPLAVDESREPEKYFITTIAFSPDNKTLISASKDGKIRLWDVIIPASKLLSNPSATLAPQRSIAVSPDGQTLITGGDDNIVRVWQ